MKTTEENLIYIENMIANAKGTIGDSSIYYLLWGYMAVSAALIQYILLVFVDFQYSWLSWPILMTLAGIANLFIGKKKSEDKIVKTYIENFMTYLWLGIVITLILVLFMMGSIQPKGAYPIIILLYGLGTFVSGGILKFAPLKLGGIACWIIGAIALYMDFQIQILLIALALVLSYIIPGHLLAKHQKNA